MDFELIILALIALAVASISCNPVIVKSISTGASIVKALGNTKSRPLYGGTVTYNITGLLEMKCQEFRWISKSFFNFISEKNKDPLNDTIVDQFKKGSNALMLEIFLDHP